MTAPSLAWGELRLYQLPNGEHVYGREFELLPAGSMFAASVILNGLVGVKATIGEDNCARVAAAAEPVVYPLRRTSREELGAYCDDVIEGWRLKQQRDAKG